MREDRSTQFSASANLQEGRKGRSHGIKNLIRDEHVTTNKFCLFKYINGAIKFFGFKCFSSSGK